MSVEKKFLVFGNKILIILFIILFCKVVSAELRINEIMVDPVDDAYDEWIEIYNDNDYAVNLSNYAIMDGSGECDIFLFGYQGSLIPARVYAIITDQFSYVYYDYNISQDALKIRVEDSAIGNGLNNDGDNINLYNDINCINLIDSFSYNTSTEEWSWALVNGIWQQVENITPGYNNSYVQICDPSVEIELDKFIYENNEVVYFTPKVRGNYNYKIEYWIENLFGEIVKSKVETNNSNQKRWTTEVEGEDSVYIIKANLTFSDCDDISLSNNFVEKTIGVKGVKDSNFSFLSIEKVYLGSDDKVKFGDTVRVKVSIYKGDTNKQSVQLWLEDNANKEISKRTRTHAYEKFKSYNLTLPLQIEPNCNSKYKDGYYNLVLEGLDKRDEERIKVEGITTSLCEKVKTSSSPDKDKKESKDITTNVSVSESMSKLTGEVIADNIEKDINKGIESNLVYQSEEEKNKRLAIYFFSLVLILLIFYFMFGKKV